jgi:hypothetical protein
MPLNKIVAVTNEIQDRLHSLDEQFIKHRISLLRRTDLRKARIDRLKARLADLLRAYVSTTIEIDGDKSIFRARKHRIDERKVFLETVSGIYPDAKYIERLGRVNRERQCIFYFGADNGVALSEVKPVMGDVVTILECKPRPDARGSLIPIGIHQMAEKHGARIGGDLPEPQIRIAEFLGNDPASIRKHKMIDDFVLEEFLRGVSDGDEHEYKLSIAIAELLFSFENDLVELRKDLGVTDGLAYPSLASESINANVAFKPEAFHRIYQPVGCERITVEENGRKTVGGTEVDSFYGPHQKARAVQPTGEIEW